MFFKQLLGPPNQLSELKVIHAVKQKQQFVSDKAEGCTPQPQEGPQVSCLLRWREGEWGGGAVT